MTTSLYVLKYRKYVGATCRSDKNDMRRERMKGRSSCTVRMYAHVRQKCSGSISAGMAL